MVFDSAAQCFELRKCLSNRFVRKKHRKFFPAITVGAAATTHLCQACADHPENLIADIVAVRIVEFLEVVYIDHRDSEHRSQSQQLFFQHPAPGEAGQFVAKRHSVRLLQNR